MLLWLLSEYLAFTDQRTANTTQNLCLQGGFRWRPFAATAPLNTIQTRQRCLGTDGFFFTNTLGFQNLRALIDPASGCLSQNGMERQAKWLTLWISLQHNYWGQVSKGPGCPASQLCQCTFNATGLATELGKQAKAF